MRYNGADGILRKMNKPWILLTNDDGVDSPILIPLMRALKDVAEVEVVVPASECSWTSKIMSRFDTLEVVHKEVAGERLTTLSGYPADCANAGIFTLFSSRPSLVVSGINMGDNAGLAYFLSSGTVGAAVEGHLAGVPALAFSQRFDPEDYNYWRSERQLTDTTEAKLSSSIEVAREIVGEVWERGLPDGADLMTVNMPVNAKVTTPRRFCPIARTSYGAFFERVNEKQKIRYGHSGYPDIVSTEDENDVAILSRGEIALSPIRFAPYIQPSSEDLARFEYNSA